MVKIFNTKEMSCKKDRYDKNLVCTSISKKGLKHQLGKDIDHAFIIRKPSKEGDNLEASAYANEDGFSSGFFNKKCASFQVKPLKSVDGKILIESRKQVVCADSKSVLTRFIKENEGYF